MSLRRLFTDHPASLGETYSQHAGVALGYAGPLAVASIAAAIHAIFPFLFKSTASATIRVLNERIARRCAACPSGPTCRSEPNYRPDLFGERFETRVG